MKKIDRYMCEICRTEYNDELSCQNCKKAHKKPCGFGAAKYISFTQTGYTANGNYPIWVNIEFEDGVVKRYKR